MALSIIPPMTQPLRWDLFCHVIDNFGDVGVSWRLAADLARRGQQVRLWIDDPSALAWMAPAGQPGVEVLRWAEPLPDREPGDVVVETFGCQLPATFVQRMRRPCPPVWINFEYLSGESYVERSHGLPSPQLEGPGQGLSKWFLYPGFTPRTAGLIREPELLPRRAAFDATAWLASHGVQRQQGERVVSLFCYENAALPTWLDSLAEVPTVLLVTPDRAARQVRSALGDGGRTGALRTVMLPYLPQDEFDHLLWASDLNFVRGEDSFSRAQWAGVPFIWQIYPQVDDFHAVKLDAFLDRYLDAAAPAQGVQIRALWHGWNGLSGVTRPTWPEGQDWQRLARDWSAHLAALPDATDCLLRFAADRG